jgi:hypothetical protein
MKPFIKIPLLFIITLVFVNSVYADGWHISDHDLHLYEPNQKAVISWDGETETMILASAVKSDDIANFAWVVPIQSSSKPEVTAGDISIFEDLVDYFKKEDDSHARMLEQGVSILESKEIDVYDITILQATSSDDLIDWLNNNGYQVPEEAKPILDKYVEKGDFYFVANKIDLTNKFVDALELIKIPSYSNNDNYYAIKNLIDSDENYKHFKNKIALNILCSDTKLPSVDKKLMEELGITDAKIDELKSKYVLNENDFCNLLIQEGGSNPTWNYENLISLFDSSSIQHCQIKEGFRLRRSCRQAEDGCYNDETPSGTRGRFDVYSDIDFCATVDLISSTDETEKTYEKLATIYSPENINQNRAIFNRLSIEIDSITKNKLEPWKKVVEYKTAIEDLKKGMSTPLKFQFKPKQPYYPLEISSLNLGSSIIEVYVMTSNPVTDQNDVLTVEESKMINSELKNKLEKHINLANAKYVTRLSYNGNLKDLTADAEFSYEKQDGFFQRVWNWISNLFE